MGTYGKPRTPIQPGSPDSHREGRPHTNPEPARSTSAQETEGALEAVGPREQGVHVDADTFVCRSWTDLAARLVWARERGYRTAKARRANGYVDRPLLPSEQVRLIGDATRVTLG